MKLEGKSELFRMLAPPVVNCEHRDEDRKPGYQFWHCGKCGAYPMLAPKRKPVRENDAHD